MVLCFTCGLYATPTSVKMCCRAAWLSRQAKSKAQSKETLYSPNNFSSSPVYNPSSPVYNPPATPEPAPEEMDTD